MARPGFTTHPKFRRLCYLLGEPEPHVYGYVEYIWHVAYENGDPCIGDALDVELAAKYPGEQGKLAEALAEVRLLDVVEGMYHVHDLFDHAPDYVQQRARKEAERRKQRVCLACGTAFHSTEMHAKYCSHACRQAGYRQRGVTDGDAPLRHCDAGVTESDAPPAPAPAPAPNKGDVSPLTPSGVRRKKSSPKGEESNPTFEKFWRAYPKKVKRQEALHAWTKLAPSPELTQRILTAVQHATTSEQWQKEKGRFVPHPPKWLNGHLWEDELQPDVPKPAPVSDQDVIHKMAQQRARLYAAAERDEL
jgi:hypothetical protein